MSPLKGLRKSFCHEHPGLTPWAQTNAALRAGSVVIVKKRIIVWLVVIAVLVLLWRLLPEWTTSGIHFGR